jgi:hypothetical protein
MSRRSRRRVHEHLHIQERPKRSPPQGEQAFDEHEPRRRDHLDSGARVRFQAVHRLADRFAAPKVAELRDEQRGVDGLRLVIEGASVERVGFEIDHTSADASDQTPDDRTLPRAGAAGQPDDHRASAFIMRRAARARRRDREAGA